MGMAWRPNHKSHAGWIEWRDDQIAHILEPTFDHSGRKILYREEVIRRCAEASAQIPQALSDDPGLSKEFEHFSEFVRAQGIMAVRDESGTRTHVLGYEVSDKDYWRGASSELTFPPLLRSQAFLRCMTEPTGYAKAVAMIDQQNETLPESQRWIVLPFKAQFIKSIDETTYGRLLVFVPNVATPEGPEDQWIQFAIATPDMNPLTPVQSVSMIAVHAAKNGESKAFLMDFMRLRNERGEIEVTPNVLLPVNPSNNCYDCHKSPVIPIHPETEYRFDSTGKLVPKLNLGEVPQRLNDRLQGYGRPDFGPVNTSAYGPSIGPVAARRPDDLIRSWSQDPSLPPASIPRIRAAMNCSSCHGNNARINYLLGVESSRDVKAFKAKIGLVQSYVENGWMPPNNDLSNQERSALWRCLLKEYYNPQDGAGCLVDWLRGK